MGRGFSGRLLLANGSPIVAAVVELYDYRQKRMVDTTRSNKQGYWECFADDPPALPSGAHKRRGAAGWGIFATWS